MSDTNVANFPAGEENNESGSGGDAVSGQRLRSFIERIERLEEEKSEILEDIKEVYAEAKATGFEPKIMRKLVRLRKMDTEKRREEEEILNLYKDAVGLA